eukprot:1041241-Pleurochrysis_carterae.AAC.2
MEAKLTDGDIKSHIERNKVKMRRCIAQSPRRGTVDLESNMFKLASKFRCIVNSTCKVLRVPMIHGKRPAAIARSSRYTSFSSQ